MTTRPLDVVVVGCGTAGTVAATLLAEQGHRVTLLEQAERPSAVGAGIMLQHLGLEVLDRLGLLTALREVSRPVRRVDALTRSGRTLMDFGYADVPGAEPALGVHRGALFGLLHDRVSASAAQVETGVVVRGVRPDVDGRMAVLVARPDTAPATAPGTDPPADHDLVVAHRADLVVGADGAQSAVRRGSGLTRRDHPYAYGALWAVVPDPEEIAADVLYQCVHGTGSYLGVLPTGRGQSSIFWSVRADRMAQVRSRGLAAWREAALPYAGRYAPLVQRVEVLLEARYRDVVVHRPYRLTTGPDGTPRGVVLLGDAAHAMSPQLGTGASLALADAWTLAHCLRSDPDLSSALPAYHAARRDHLRWYSWWTRLMMPAFQSELVPLGWARDLLAAPVAHLPGVRRQFVTTLMGHRTSPWRTWPLPGTP